MTPCPCGQPAGYACEKPADTRIWRAVPQGSGPWCQTCAWQGAARRTLEDTLGLTQGVLL